MKAHRRTRNALRALALAGCASALVLPSVAGARPVDQSVAAPAAPSTSYHRHGRPAAFATAGTTGYPLPAGFKTDAQSSGQASTAGTAGYQLPADFSTDAQSGGSVSTAAQAPSVVVREIRTVTNGSDHTLALVLASAALGIALCGSAYAVFRTTRIQRRVLGSNS